MIALVFTVLIVLLVAGFACWLVGMIPFIWPLLKQILQGAILFGALLWLLYTLYDTFAGHGSGLGHVRIP
jgi:hypothetical protein